MLQRGLHRLHCPQSGPTRQSYLLGRTPRTGREFRQYVLVSYRWSSDGREAARTCEYKEVKIKARENSKGDLQGDGGGASREKTME